MTNPNMPRPPARDWTVLTLMALLAVLVIASFASLPLKWREFFTLDAINSTVELLQGFAPPNLSEGFVVKTAWATVETMAMSALGTLLAVVAGLAFSLPASGRFGGAARGAMRALLNVLR